MLLSMFPPKVHFYGIIFFFQALAKSYNFGPALSLSRSNNLHWLLLHLSNLNVREKVLKMNVNYTELLDYSACITTCQRVWSGKAKKNNVPTYNFQPNSISENPPITAKQKVKYIKISSPNPNMFCCLPVHCFPIIHHASAQTWLMNGGVEPGGGLVGLTPHPPTFFFK